MNTDNERRAFEEVAKSKPIEGKPKRKHPWRTFAPGYLQDNDRSFTHPSLPGKLSRPI